MGQVKETTASKSGLVLIVDDDRDGREMYADFLGLAGLAIAQAHNGFQALDKATHLRPDIIVTDLAIPGIDGFELCRRLRAQEETRSIPVIAVTGRYVQNHDKERARQAGFSAILFKPCEPQVVLEEIRRWLSSSGEQQEGEE